MKPCIALGALLVAIASPVGLETSAPEQIITAQITAQTTANRHEALVKTYCVTCHSTRAASGGLALEGLDLQAGQTRRVDLMLCVVSTKRWQLWYLLDRQSPDFDRAYIPFDDDSEALAEVRALRSSPDGKYLAVQHSAEGHPSIDVVDLPALVRDKAYRRVGDRIDSYPGTVSIQSWRGTALEVTSDVLLSHSPDGPSFAPLLADETFSWNFLTGEIVPLRDALRNPVQYYAAALSAAAPDARRDAISALARLDDLSAVPFLERALAVETDVLAREEIVEALNRLTDVGNSLNGCLQGRDMSRAGHIVAEPIATLFVDGQSRPVDEMLCIVNQSRDPDRAMAQSWFRLDRGVNGKSTRVRSGGGGSDRVDGLRPSVDGRYLAIRYVKIHEQPPVGYVEIIDLPALIRHSRYRSIRTVHDYPESVSLGGWNADVLELIRDKDNSQFRVTP